MKTSIAHNYTLLSMQKHYYKCHGKALIKEYSTNIVPTLCWYIIKILFSSKNLRLVISGIL